MTRSSLRLLLPLLATVPLFAQGEVDLRSAAKKGSSVWLVQDDKRSQTFEAMGQEMESSQHIVRTVHLTVTDVDDKGNLAVTVKVVRVHGSLANPSMDEIEFDSLKPADSVEDDPTGGMMKSMVENLQAGAGKSFTAKVSPHGRMLELVDAKEMMQKSASGQGVEEGQLRQIIEIAFGRLSDKPVAVGGKWTHEDKGQSGRLPVTQKIEMTLAKAEADSFEITATGTVEKPAAPAAEGAEEENPMAAAARSMKISNGKVTARQKVSRQDGFVVEGTMDVSMDAEMSMGGMAIPMTIKTVTSVKRTSEAEAQPKKEEPKKEEAKKPADGHGK